MLKKITWMAAATFAILLAAAPAFAQTDEPDGTMLELYYDRLEISVASLENRIAFGREVLDLSDELITALDEAGIDTTGLVTAGQAYAAALNDAEDLVEEAADILETPEGFDDEGSVTNAREAANTLIDARLLLSEANITLRQATLDLRSAIRDIREEINESR